MDLIENSANICIPRAVLWDLWCWSLQRKPGCLSMSTTWANLTLGNRSASRFTLHTHTKLRAEEAQTQTIFCTCLLILGDDGLRLLDSVSFVFQWAGTPNTIFFFSDAGFCCMKPPLSSFRRQISFYTQGHSNMNKLATCARQVCPFYISMIRGVKSILKGWILLYETTPLIRIRRQIFFNTPGHWNISKYDQKAAGELPNLQPVLAILISSHESRGGPQRTYEACWKQTSCSSSCFYVQGTWTWVAIVIMKF